MWSVTVQNNSNNAVVAPSNAVQYVEGQVAVIGVSNVGSIYLLDVGHQGGGPHYWAVRVTTGTSFNQLWWYDGGGQCTLTINADNSFSLSGQGQTIGGPIGVPVLPIISLPGGTQLTANAFTNAAFLQRVSVTVSGDTAVRQWSGTGEGNVPIASNASFVTPGAGGTNLLATISIDASWNAGTTWAHSLISPPSRCAVMRFNQFIFVSEDQNDFDWNDLTLLLSWWAPV